MRNNEKYQSKKTKKLENINNKIKIKGILAVGISYLSTFFLLAIIEDLLMIDSFIFHLISNCIEIVGSLAVAKIAYKKFMDNYHKNQKLIDKINVQEEVNKLNEEEKDLVKEISKDEKLIDAINYISDLEFNEERVELLKNVILNKNVLNTMQVLDDKKCIKALPKYDFDSIKLEQEYQKAIEIGTKPKSLKKTMNEIKKNFRSEK